MKLLERRRALMSALSKFIRIILGKPPLTLNACIDDKSTIDYKLYGESVQDGTPTPNSPIEVESVGEKTVNLFDINKFITLSGNSTYYEINENGELVQKTNDYRSNDSLPTIITLPAGTYRVSTYVDSAHRWYNKTTKSALGEPTFTLTETSEIAVKWRIGSNKVIGKLMLWEGSEKRDYEPYGKYKIPVKATNGTDEITTNIYLDEPLRKIGDYADYIDFENRVVVRNVKRLDLKNAVGIYSWIGKKGVTFQGVLDKKYTRNNNALCNRNYYWTANGGEKLTMWLGVESNTLFWIGILDYLGFTTLAEFNEWLANNPTYLLYGSDIPTETPIELPTLPTFKGTTIYSVDTNIQPSNMEVTYYSKERSVS